MKKAAVVLACLCFTIVGAKAQEQNYNFQRAMELYNNGQSADAVEYLDKEIRDNPKNAGYCYAYLASIHLHHEYYGDALGYINKSIQTIPKKDKKFLSNAYSERADIYLAMADTIHAIENYNKAIKTDKTNASALFRLGAVSMDKEDYANAEISYKRCIEIDNSICEGYWGLGNVYSRRKQYKEALEQYNHAIKLDGAKSILYALRSEVYQNLQQYNEQVDDIITALDIDANAYAYHLMITLDYEQMSVMKTKLIIQSNKNPNQYQWLYYLGSICEQQHNYKKAIEYYEKGNKIEINATWYKRIADCYIELGNYNKALQYIDEVIEADTSDMEAVMTKANILNEMGRTKEAIKELDKYITVYPEYYWGYYRRGWFKEEIKDFDGAIEDYTTAIVLEPNYPYSYQCRGKMYLDKGQKYLAEKDFKKTVELDSIPKGNSCAMYAYFYLGQTDKAKEFMDSVMAHSNDSSYYDAACLYSVIGEKRKAVNYLENALRKGYRRFAHIERDRDLDNIRNMQEFKDLIKKYKAIAEEENT